jgi:uncharacterized membrane protein YjfL (UPF0719 family)
MTDMIYWDHYYDSILLTNLAIVIALFTSLRFFSGAIARIKASDELMRKDNPAFGLSLSGVIFGVALILSGTIFGNPDDNATKSALTILWHGALCIVFLSFTRLIFDHVTFPKIHVRDEIVKGNIAVGIADAANVIASALIIRSVLVWVSANSIEGVTALLFGYLISQALLTGATFVRFKLFGKISNGSCIQEQLRTGNIALALRFAGQKIGTAFAITVASNVIASEVYEMIPVLVTWFFVSIVAIVALKLISMLAEFVILYQIDLNKEVIEQRNIAIGAVEAIIFISLGLLLTSL